MKVLRLRNAAALLMSYVFITSAGVANAQSTAQTHNLSLPYLGWAYPGTPATLETDLKFLADPGPTTPWFLSHQFVLEDANGAYSSGGYIGMQTNMMGSNAKGVMFSIWNATSAKPGNGATCQPFGGEGVGMQCYLAYPWVAGKTYRLRVVNDRGSAYSAYVIDTSTATPTVTYIGQIQAPVSAVNLGRNSVQWAEYYGQAPANCADFPYVKAQWSRPKGDNGVILADKPTIQYAETAYCRNTAVIASGSDYLMEGGNPAAGNRQHLTNSTGKYLNQVTTNGACGGAGVKADAGTITACTGLTRIPLGGGKVALQAENGLYLSCDNGGGAGVSANERTVSTYATFTETLASGKVSYKSSGGRYLTVASWGTLDLKCSAYLASTTEKFTPFANKASSATVTASSDNPSTGQTVSKAIDGAATGYPNDYTREWTTNGENVGAWIQLKWPTTTSVKQVILYDRPNMNDQILGGTLLFSDGSSLKVGALPNDGSPLSISFTAKNVTWIKFRVDQATGWIGLSEFEVF
ncbi:Fascin domain-containing protein [Paucimonas lemoignei]|uniref:Fascin domain-containing protein n=1 Tax=Paucimonas lemoignei TaxID=29443 RepID=A0A4R3HS56_PAULE|nr:DUF3472 domain-containing protein [Paucimonas lemoignei]TCS35967.1 Fascin domain-containing protein [Paucimonas lemoignei]